MRHKDIHYWGRYCMFLLLIAINSEQTFPKMARPKGTISFFGNPPLDHKMHITVWFPFLDIWPWKLICEYLNEISTKYHHITTFRKPLTTTIKAMGHDDIITIWQYSKTLSNDTHIIYFQKRQQLIMPSDTSVIGAMWKYSRIPSKWYPYHIFPKKAILMMPSDASFHMYCVKVLTSCCKMMPISYISKKGNGTWLHLLCCVVTLWGSHNIA